MGLFDKKKKGRDDFDSPVEEIDLGASSPVTAEGRRGDPEEAETVDFTAVPAALKAPGREGERRRSRASAATRSTPPPSYGIEEAVALMRTLPSENIELVVQVVKHTLESAHIDIGSIIEDASAKQERIEGRVTVLRDAIAELEREIETRRAEIAQLETDHRETTRVKERLVLAEKLSQSGRADTTLDAVDREVPPPRSKPAAQPPPLPGSPAGASAGSTPADQTPVGGTPALGSPTHLGSGSHAIPSAVGPGGPVVGSFNQKASTHTVPTKK